MITSKQFRKAKKKYRILWLKVYDTLGKAKFQLQAAKENELAHEVEEIRQKVLIAANDVDPKNF